MVQEAGGWGAVFVSDAAAHHALYGLPSRG
jgi:hypothetical protein